MRVHLVHHAEAVGPATDPQRPLSTVGVRQASWLADEAHRAGVAPAMIWHSGKLRARQTAKAFLRTCVPFAEFRMVRGLRPDDPPTWMRDELAGEEGEVMLVGHRPHIVLLAELLGADGPVPLHGAVSLERVSPGRYEEWWRAEPPPP